MMIMMIVCLKFLKSRGEPVGGLPLLPLNIRASSQMHGSSSQYQLSVSQR